MIDQGDWERLLVAELVQMGIPLVLVLLASVSDLRKREIPNWIPLTLLIWAGTARCLGLIDSNWLDFGTGLLGGLLAPLVIHARGAMGAGDVKLMTGLGACVGPCSVLVLFGIACTFCSLEAMIRRTRREEETAYAHAIALGLMSLIGIRCCQSF